MQNQTDLNSQTVTILSFQGLLTANEEFAAEVTRLYEEEEKLSREHADTKQHLESNISDLKQKLEDDRDDWETQRRKMEDQEQRLMESIKMLSQDNMRLITEREEETINQSKTHQVMITHNHNTAGVDRNVYAFT